MSRSRVKLGTGNPIPIQPMNFISSAFAQDQAPAAPGGGALGMFLPLIVVFVIFYFLIFRPQQKQQKQRVRMLSELRKGDEVITNGGIYGKIVELQDASVMLQIANNVVIKLDRTQVNIVRNPVEPSSEKK